MRRSVATFKHRRGKGLALFSLALMTALVVAAAAGATVWTDQDDYAPGSVVLISGDNSNAAGYLAGETVPSSSRDRMTGQRRSTRSPTRLVPGRAR
jgi:uncharacterized membrane protein